MVRFYYVGVSPSKCLGSCFREDGCWELVMRFRVYEGLNILGTTKPLCNVTSVGLHVKGSLCEGFVVPTLMH